MSWEDTCKTDNYARANFKLSVLSSPLILPETKTRKQFVSCKACVATTFKIMFSVAMDFKSVRFEPFFIMLAFALTFRMSEMCQIHLMQKFSKKLMKNFILLYFCKQFLRYSRRPYQAVPSLVRFHVLERLSFPGSVAIDPIAFELRFSALERQTSTD